MLQLDFGFTVRPLISLSETEKVIKDKRIIYPVPSRPTLIKWLESGQLEGKQSSITGRWYVYQDSLIGFARKLAVNDPAMVF